MNESPPLKLMPRSYFSWGRVGETLLQNLQSQEAATLLRYWLSIGTPNSPPSRSALDPIEMAEILPKVWLVDYLLNEDRLRYRLAGEEVSIHHGFSVSGRYLDELVERDVYPRVAGYFLDCVKKPSIAHLKGTLFQEADRPGFGERLLLPLISEGGTSEGIIGITVRDFYYKDQSNARQHSRRVLEILPLDGTAKTRQVT